MFIVVLPANFSLVTPGWLGRACREELCRIAVADFYRRNALLVQPELMLNVKAPV